MSGKCEQSEISRWGREADKQAEDIKSDRASDGKSPRGLTTGESPPGPRDPSTGSALGFDSHDPASQIGAE
ncbi:hypothetical protein ALC53_08031 [Atta colombica]|uniref:Uncharacterized protein n=1 Tax=Atta colombica TaxID=520822 RepID=A0A195BBS1_9HYME|nr:hypothetical protein ALC53_08031 [Atta colombica]